MKIKKFLCGLMAAAVLVTSAVPVSAATKSATSATASTEVTVKKPSKVTLTAGSKKIKVTIKKVSGAKGYQIQYATNKKMTSGKKTIKTTKTTYTISKLKSKKTYYVRVRAYKTSGKKTVYSKWSTIKSKKTKK